MPEANAIPHSKICEIEDFRDPDLVATIREIGGAELAVQPDFPSGREHRKTWEIAMTARAFRDHGVLGETSEILGVGAGHERTLYWLTNHARRVFATDLYLSEDSWSDVDSSHRMLSEPELFAPPPPPGWNPRRLVAQHMDALDLRYEDESFDAVFSSSSIEHFGTFSDVRRSIEEIY